MSASVKTKTITIANGETESEAWSAGGARLFAFDFETMTSTAATFEHATSFDGPYRPVVDKDGTPISITVASDTCVSDGSVTGALAPLQFLKLVVGTAEDAAREVQVTMRD